MDKVNLGTTSIDKAKNLHEQFPLEIQDFFAYLKFYIKYVETISIPTEMASDDNIGTARTFSQHRILDYLHQYPDLMESNSLAFGYMLFQPSSAEFVEKCILSYAAHADCSERFKDYVYACYL